MKTKSMGKLISLGVVVFMLISATSLWAAEFTLKMSVMHGPKAGKYKNGHLPYAKAIEQATKGRVKVQLFPSNSLATARENYDATINGLVDIGFIALPHYPNRFPLADVLSLPGAIIEDSKMAGRIVWALYEKYPQFRDHFKEVQMLFLTGYAPVSICTVDRQIDKLEDLKGLRLRFAAKGGTAFLKASGASPVNMPPSELFLNLQKGVVKGSGIGWEGQRSFGATKLCKHYTSTPMIPGPYFAFFMNKNKFNSLPKEIRDAIMSVSGKAGMEFFSDGDMKNTNMTLDEIRAAGYKIDHLSDAEKKRWSELAQKTADKLIEKIAKKGVPARAFYNDMIKLADELK